MRLVKPRKPQLLGEGKHAKLGCASSHAVTGGWRAGMPFSVKVYHKTKQHLILVTEDTTFGECDLGLRLFLSLNAYFPPG